MCPDHASKTNVFGFHACTLVFQRWVPSRSRAKLNPISSHSAPCLSCILKCVPRRSSTLNNVSPKFLNFDEVGWFMKFPDKIAQRLAEAPNVLFLLYSVSLEHCRQTKHELQSGFCLSSPMTGQHQHLHLMPLLEVSTLSILDQTSEQSWNPNPFCLCLAPPEAWHRWLKRQAEGTTSSLQKYGRNPTPHVQGKTMNKNLTKCGQDSWTKNSGILSAGRIHHVMWFFFEILAQKTPEIISVHDVWEPWKQALLASRDVIISSQFAARIRRGFFTLGDGCWLPILTVFGQMVVHSFALYLGLGFQSDSPLLKRLS